MIYLDSAAMHPVLPCARDAFLRAPFGNPSSEHAVGQYARDALEQAREKISVLIGCDPQEVYFTATATEAAAMAWSSIAKTKEFLAIVSDVEHHAVSANADALEFSFTKQYAVASMIANNETGGIRNPPSIARLWLCDATAAVGHIPISFKELGCHYLLFDTIKFGGVPGAAALIAKKNAPISPLIRGGGQERGMRSGTENVPAICAMAAALKWQTEHMEKNTAKLSKLQDFMKAQLNEIPKIQWNTPFHLPHLPHILNISFDGVDAKALVLLLSKEGVMVSPGAACSNGLNEPSHVIMAMFNDEARARSAIRISLSHENTIDECAEAARKIKDAVEYLRALS